MSFNGIPMELLGEFTPQQQILLEAIANQMEQIQGGIGLPADGYPTRQELITAGISAALDSGAVTVPTFDHGETSGLTDDDHPHYHNDARGDARYYTQAAADAAFAALSHNHAASEITSGTLPDARVAEANVTQHQAALALAATQLTSGSIPDARVAETNVTQHEAALDLAATQITSGSVPDARVSESSVTQHEGALTLTKSQISDFSSSVSIGNEVLNESMALWREGTTRVLTTGGHFADVWKWEVSGGGAATVNRYATVPAVSVLGFIPSFAAEVEITTADASLAAGDYARVKTPIEGYNATRLYQRAMRLRFATAHARTGTYCVCLRNNADDRQVVFEYTQSVADTWELQEFSIPASPSAGTWEKTNSAGFYLELWLASGTDHHIAGAAGSWLNETSKRVTSSQINGIAATSDRFRFCGVNLVASASAVEDPVPRSVAEEIALVDRYYSASHFPDGTSSTRLLHVPVAITSGLYRHSFSFQTAMRAAPTMAKQNDTYGSASGLGFGHSAVTGFNANINVSGTGGFCFFDYLADARL